MYSRTEIITPEKAAEYLSRNIVNRPLKKDKIRQYAAAMKAGKWQLTHQGIAFKSTGELGDGQNRLSAVIEAGVPVPMTVFYDMDATILDRGTPRSDRDTLIMSGIDSNVASKSATAAFNFLYKYAYGSKPGDDVKIDFFKAYGDQIYKAATTVTAKSDGVCITNLAPVIAATFCAIVCGVNEAGLKDFFRVANSTVNYDPKMSAATQMRTYILIDFRSRNWMDNRDLFNLTTVAIRDAMQGVPRNRKYRKQTKPVFYDFVVAKVLDKYHAYA